MGERQPLTDARLEIILAYGFGFSFIFTYAALAFVVAFTKPTAEVAEVLLDVLGALGPLGGAFAGFAFGRSRSVSGETEKNHPKGS